MANMTKREFLKAIASMNGIDAELSLYAEQELKKMDEKNEKRRNSPSKKSQENEPIKAAIVDFLKDKSEPTVASVIAENVEGCTSTQKASALCRQMVADGRLESVDVKVKGKGTQKGYFLV
jgi:hypothetical protein